MFQDLKKLLKDAEPEIQVNLSDDPIQWTKQTRVIKKKQFGFDNRDYLLPIYRDLSKTIHIVKARQMEITEFALNWLLFHLTKNPETIGLYMSDRKNHINVFYNSRLRKAINSSTTLESLVAEQSSSRILFKNNSELYLFSAWDNFEASRSIPADFAIIDEIQSINVEAIPILQETLSKSQFGRLVCIGTGSEQGDHWYKIWHGGDQKEWDFQSKSWIAKKPQNFDTASTYRITQHMACWLDQNKIHKKEQEYTPRRFANEVLGDWYGSAKRPLIDRDIHALFDVSSDLKSPDQVDYAQGPLYMGVDWGTGSHSFTVPWIWQLVDDKIPRFNLIYTRLITEQSTEKQADMIVNLIDDYDIKQVVVDEAGGTRQVQKLFESYREKIFTCHYVTRPQKTLELDFSKSRVIVDRTWIIETIIDLIKRPYTVSSYTIPRIMIPHKTPRQIDWIVDHFTCIESEVSIAGANQYLRYVNPQGSNDDALHACIYAYLASKLKKKSATFAIGTMGGG